MLDKTETGRVKAIKRFDLFLALKQLGTLNELLVLIKNRSYATRNCILSHIPKLASAKFPDNPTWISSPFNTWYSTLRDDTRKSILRRNLKGGIKASPGDEKNPIGRELLSVICKGLLELGMAESEKQRCAINMPFAAIGRSGEVSLSSWNKTDWCPY